MSVIKNDDNIKSKGTKSKAVYELPAVVRREKNEISFEKALIISLILHPAVLIIILLTSLVLKFLGIDFDLLKKPDLKPKDIEFVLVEKEAEPIDKNTKNRADKNSRAGGIHDPKRPVSLPQAPAPKAPAKKPQIQQPKKQAVQKPKPAVQKPKPQVQKPVAKKPAPAKTPTPAPKAPAPRPVAKPTMPKPTAKPLSNFNIPIPKSAIPPIAQPSTAPVTSAPKIGGSSSGKSASSGVSAPTPSFSASSSGSSGARGGQAGGQGRFSNSNGYGNGNLGNPGPGNPKGAPGIDAIKEPDFGPYMKELQRRIKMNWDPPKGNESKRVVLLFVISRDGRLMNVKVLRSSGLQAADNAAINAVKLTAPFRPLPPEFRGNSVDIQFTFDYNVLGVSMY